MGVDVIHCRNLNSHTCHREAVRTVRGNLTIKNNVRHAQVIRKWHTNWSILRKNHNAALVIAKTQLARRAVHAARLNATQLGLFNLKVSRKYCTNHCGNNVVSLIKVLSSANNLQRNRISVLIHIIVAHVNEGNVHVIRIRMRLFAHNLSCNNIIKVSANTLYSFNLSARAHKLTLKVFWVLRKINERLQPFIRYTHVIAFLIRRR